MFATLAPRLLALVSFAFMLVMNVLATALPLNDQATNEISDRYDTLFAPIGFTFAIWGVIYLLLGVYTVVQLVADNAVIRSITPWFITGNVLNGLWILAWHYEQLWVSAAIIIGLLWTLIRINGITPAVRTTAGSTFALRVPFALYFGWVTVATVANISAALVQSGFTGELWLGPEIWTVVVLVVAATIGSGAAMVNSSPTYALVLVWAFWGILSRHLSATEWDRDYPAVILTAQILVPVLGLVALAALVRWLAQPVVDWPTTSVRNAA